MKLYWYRGEEPNFGDELNQFVWPKLLPNVFDADNSCIFLGIGSILFDNHPRDSQKIVMGAGYGGYTALPNFGDGTWKTYFVRGPLTAQRLGLNSNLALADSGILVRTLVNRPNITRPTISFIPHIASLRRGQWREVCQAAGITFIDPRSDVEKVISQLLASKVVVAEAMHGAIIADALRIPWIPVVPLNPMNRMKWLDWTESLGIPYRPAKLLPSSLYEFKLYKLSGSRVASKLASIVDESVFSQSVNAQFLELAASRLVKIASITSFLSDDSRIDNVTDAMLQKVEDFRLSL